METVIAWALFGTLAALNIAFVVYHLRKDNKTDYDREDDNQNALDKAGLDFMLYGVGCIKIDYDKAGNEILTRVEFNNITAEQLNDLQIESNEQ